MRSNLFLAILISLIGMCALYYSGHTLVSVYRYLRLSENTPVSSIEWSVHTINGDAYAPKATYSFIHNDSSYNGETVWSEYDRNPLVARDSIKKLKTLSWSVWFNPNNPSFSSLQRKFPFKDFFSSLILWGLVLYFFSLGRYVKTLYK